MTSPHALFWKCAGLVTAESCGFVPEELLKKIRRDRKLRKSDRCTALLLAAVDKALHSPAHGVPEREIIPDSSCGIVFASSLGPEGTISAFQDDLMDYPEEQVMPTTFSHSVHNAGASCISMAYGITGPSFSITGFRELPSQAFRVAADLLFSETAAQVLLILAEEKTLVSDAMRSAGIALSPESAACILLECRGPGKEIKLPHGSAGFESIEDFYRRIIGKEALNQ